MTAEEATGEVFWRAFKSLKPEERGAFVDRLLADRRLREDMMDAAIVAARRDEPGVPMDQVLRGLRKKRAHTV